MNRKGLSDQWSLVLGKSFHVEQFDLEMQCAVGWNLGRTAGFPVAHFRRDFQLNHPALTDQLHPFGPAGDHAPQAEGRWLRAIVGRIKNRSIVQPAGIVDRYLVVRGGPLPIAFAKNSVLEPRFSHRELGWRIGVNDAGAGSLLWTTGDGAEGGECQGQSQRLDRSVQLRKHAVPYRKIRGIVGVAVRYYFATC